VIYSGTPRNLARLAKVLREGGLVAVPTETVYGLAADAFNERACARIFSAKGRPKADPLIVHVRGWSDVEAIAETNDAARRLADSFWPGPLTLVLVKKPSIPRTVTAGRASVAVRAPSHPLFRRLLALTGRPLAAPSANPFGYVSPTTAEHVRSGLGKKVAHILDGGPSTIGLESTIVDLREPLVPRLLRPGRVTRAQIEKILGVRLRVPAKPSRAGGARVAPGQFARHYSPRTPVVPHGRLTERQAGRGDPRDAWLFLARPAALRGANIFWLDPRGDLRAAGRRLFATLRRLDEAGFRRIHVELAPGPGLAEAINDRLRRAGKRG
jgi:L-threonylcarbamoyladenylate synthase